MTTDFESVGVKHQVSLAVVHPRLAASLPVNE